MLIKRNFSGCAIAGVLSLSAGTASATTFDINVNFIGGLTASQQAVFSAAEAFWESQITGYQEDLGPSLTLTIDAQGAAIDGVGGILGSAGPTGGVVSPNYLLATTGAMTFDSADLGAMEVAGTLLNVILHEMAHVMGFGTLWSASAATGGAYLGLQEVYTAGTGQYTGAYALAAYQAEVDPFATFVPVELGGGSGTADGHWDEPDGGGFAELMTGWLDAGAFVSSYTIASFADIGYTTSVTHPVPAPAGILLMASGIGLLGVVRRRRKAKA